MKFHFRASFGIFKLDYNKLEIVFNELFSVLPLRVLKPPGGGSSDIFGFSSSDDKLVKSKKYAPSTFSIGDEAEEERKPVDLSDGASTPSHSSISNGSPNTSEPNTPRSG